MSVKKNAGGRPAKHSFKKLNDEAIKYLNTAEYPTVIGFAVEMGYSKGHIYDLKKQNKEFSDTLDRIVTKREHLLEINGLNGNYNSNLAKFALSQLGWTEKQIVENSNKHSITFEEVEVPDAST